MPSTVGPEGESPEELEEEESEEPTQQRQVRCTKHPCHHAFRGSSKSKRWQSPRFPVTYGWQAAVWSRGRWLPHSGLIGGCVATFRGRHLRARVNGCHGHVKLRYRGRERFTLFWQLSR
jgi:hypothetical protein